MDKIRSTVERLSSTDVSVQENCLRILINISTENEYHNTILNLVGNKRFKELIQSNNEVIQMLSTWLLSHLSLKYENSGIILKSDMLEIIIKLLKVENEDISEKVLWLMVNLTLNRDYSHYLIAEYGVVESLIEFLKKKNNGGSNNSSLIILSAGTLRNLLHKDTCGEYLDNQKIFCHSGAIQHVNSQLSNTTRYNTISSSNQQLILSLTSLIHVLTIYHPVIRRILAISGILNHLISLLSSPSTQIQIKEQVIKILINLSLTEETERPILAAGAIMPLVDIVVSISSSLDLKSLCVSCLANLTSNSEIRRVLRSNYLIDGLSELLKDEMAIASSQLLESISLLIANLCIDEHCRFKICQSDCDRALMELVNYPHVTVRDSIINALDNIKVPISFETQNELAIIEDMSDLDPFDSLNSNFNSLLSNTLNNQNNINNNHLNQSPPNNNNFNSSSILRISRSMSPIHQSNHFSNGGNGKTLEYNQSSLPTQFTTPTSTPQIIINNKPTTTTTTTTKTIEPIIDDTPNKLFKRGRIIKELIDTEQAYVHSLSICIRVYYNPLVVSPTVPPIIGIELVETIFSNIDKVFRINCEFLKKLRGMTDNKDVLELAHVFQWYWDQQFTIPEYRTYINNFNKAMDVVYENRAKQPRFKEFLEKCQFSEQCKSETIDSYLIRPVQRLPRYILLLTDLLVHTVDMLERNAIEEVLKRTKLITDQLNESKRKAENLSKLVMLQEKVIGLTEILNSSIGISSVSSGSSNSISISNVIVGGTSNSGGTSSNNGNSNHGNGITVYLNGNNVNGTGGGSVSLNSSVNSSNGNSGNNVVNGHNIMTTPSPLSINRELLKDGLMMESRLKKVSKYRYFILLNDILFITKQKKSKYSIYKTIPLIDLKVLDVPQVSNENGLFCFQINWSGDKSEDGLLISTSEQDKEDWLLELRNSIKMAKSNQMTNKLLFLQSQRGHNTLSS